MASSGAMIKIRAFAVLAFVVLGARFAFAEESLRRVGRLSIAVDESSAYPGGLVTVHVRSGLRYGVVHAILEGRRCPFLNSHRGLRALVPVPVDARPGPMTLGIEVRSGRGRQRFAVPVTVAERTYPGRTVLLPEVKKAMLTQPAGVRDGRLVPLYLRTVTAKQEWQGPFRAPLSATPEASFGCPQTYDAPAPVEAKTDAIWGEYHRGLDYLVPPGTPVTSPAAGNVLFAGPLVLMGETRMLDTGPGL